MKKEFDVWVGEFEGHSIKVTNNGKAKLYIDGIEAAKETGLVHLEYELKAAIPDTEYIVIARLSGTDDIIVTCEVMLAKKMDVVYGKEDQDGLFTPYTEEEIQKKRKDAETAVAISAATTLFL